LFIFLIIKLIIFYVKLIDSKLLDIAIC